MTTGTSPGPRRAHRACIAMLAAGAALVAAGCGSSHDVSSPDTGDPTAAATSASPSAAATTPAAASTSAAPAGPTAPLTGLAVASDALARRPVVAVDIATDAGSPAPRGLAAADVVFQEAGSSSDSRMIALYQSRDARVGPVGPTRPADGKVLGFFRPVLADTGGPKGFVAVLRTFPVVDATPARAPASYETSGGVLTVSTARLRGRAAHGATAPRGAFAFADGDQPLASIGGRAARELTVTVGGRQVARWTYSAAKGGWTGSSAAAGTVANVVVEQVPFKTVQTHHPIGQKLPSAVPFGRGRCVVASAGRAASGSYWMPGPNMLTNLADAAGVPLRLRAGRTWVLLVPTDARIDVRSR